MKNKPLWLWGMVLIAGATTANFVLPPITGDDDFSQGQRMGRGGLMMLAWIVGAGLMLASAIRAIRSKSKRN